MRPCGAWLESGGANEAPVLGDRGGGDVDDRVSVFVDRFQRQPARCRSRRGGPRAVGTPSSQAIDEDQRLTVARVGADAGGVVELGGRARLTIPPGALTDDAEVRLTAIGAAPSEIAFPLEQAVAQPVNVEIRRAELTEPATLELLFDTDTVTLPDDPVIATPSQWDDDEESWVQFDATIDVDEGVVSTTSQTPTGWWRPSVWDWSRLPAVVDALFVGLDEADVPEPGCTTPRPNWVERVEVSDAAVDPAHVCAGGFEGQLAVRLTNRRPFTLAVDSTQAPAWGWTNTADRVHLLLSEIVRSAQPGFGPQFILPRFTEGAIGVDAGNFAGGRILGEASSTTMAIDVAVLVLEALDGGGQLDDWKPLVACAIPTEDEAVDPSEASKIVERLWRCARRFSRFRALPTRIRRRRDRRARSARRDRQLRRRGRGHDDGIRQQQRRPVLDRSGAGGRRAHPQHHHDSGPDDHAGAPAPAQEHLRTDRAHPAPQQPAAPAGADPAGAHHPTAASAHDEEAADPAHAAAGHAAAAHAAAAHAAAADAAAADAAAADAAAAHAAAADAAAADAAAAHAAAADAAAAHAAAAHAAAAHAAAAHATTTTTADHGVAP